MNERSAETAQRAIAAAHRCAASGCPDEDTLIAFADGRLPVTTRDLVAARVTACERCAAAVRVALNASAWADKLATDIQRAGLPDSGHSPPRRARPPRQSWKPLAMAASLILFVGAGIVLRQSPTDDVLRGPVVFSTTPIDGALLSLAPERLVWPCDTVPAATRVELLAADATLRWSGAAANCEATLPEQTRRALAPGAYMWRVRNAAGETLIGPVAFRIAP